MIFRKVLFIFCLTFVPVITQAALESRFPALDSHQQGQLDQFQMVVTTGTRKDKTWPEVQMRRIVRADPLTSVAIFLALDHQKEYVPNLLKSEPIRHVTPTEVHTAYELKLPWPLANSVYTHGSKLSKRGECYWVEWYLVESNSADNVEGFASFCPHAKGTYMEYQNFVEPKSVFAGLFEGNMIEDSSQSIEAILKYVEKCDKSKKWLVEKYSQIIIDSLNGKNPYQKLIEKN